MEDNTPERVVRPQAPQTIFLPSDQVFTRFIASCVRMNSGYKMSQFRAFTGYVTTPLLAELCRR
jgi:hypothetical protein